MACAQNYLGVLEAVWGKDPKDALDWFEKAIADRGGDATTHETEIRRLAEQNKRVLKGGGPFTWWVQGDPAPGADEQDDGDAIAPNRGSKPPATGVPSTPPPIAVMLLNAQGALRQAWASAKRKQFGEALRLAEAARDLAPKDADPYVVLALVYEGKGWLREALDVLGAVPPKATYKEKVKAADGRAAIEDRHPELRWEPTRLRDTDYFRLRYEGPDRAADQTLRCLEDTRKDALEGFGVELPVVYVRLFPDKEGLLEYTTLRQQRLPPEWISAYAIPSSHSPAIVAYARDGCAPRLSLRHEYAHLVMRSLAGNNADLPRWLDEGFARTVEFHPKTPTQFLREVWRRGPLPSPEDLEAFWTDRQAMRLATPEQAGLCYNTAHGAVSFLLKEHGHDMVLEWLLMIRRGERARSSFEKLTGGTWEQFFDYWTRTCLR